MKDKEVAIQWHITPDTPEHKQPKWKRSVTITDDGVVMAPAIIAGNEKQVLRAAVLAGTPLIMNKGHAYLPTSWMAKEYPDSIEVCRIIESSLLGLKGW